MCLIRKLSTNGLRGDLRMMSSKPTSGPARPFIEWCLDMWRNGYGSEHSVYLALGYNVGKSSDQGVGYMENRNLYRTNQRLRARAGLLIVLLIVLGTRGAVWGQTQSAGAGESLAAWGKIVTVLQHPRCLNCHQRNSPLQEDSRRMHIPH